MRDLRLGKGARVSLLGSRHTDIAWRQSSNDVVITVPVIEDGELPFAGPRVFRIEGEIAADEAVGARMSERQKTVRRALQVALGAMLLAVVWWPGMNYFGFCHGSGRFLTEREKIDAAIEDAISPYPPPLASLGNYPPKDPIPYASIEEFRRLNPNCCTLSNSARKAPEVSFFSRVKGTNSTYVLVNFLVRFRDEDGNEVSEPASTFSAITNCGYAWAGY